MEQVTVSSIANVGLGAGGIYFNLV